jgi:hypothetical protein
VKITLTSALMHGSERLEPGDSLEVSDYSAQKLIARGLAKAATKPKAAKKPKAEKPATDD